MKKRMKVMTAPTRAATTPGRRRYEVISILKDTVFGMEETSKSFRHEIK